MVHVHVHVEQSWRNRLKIKSVHVHRHHVPFSHVIKAGQRKYIGHVQWEQRFSFHFCVSHTYCLRLRSTRFGTLFWIKKRVNKVANEIRFSNIAFRTRLESNETQKRVRTNFINHPDWIKRETRFQKESVLLFNDFTRIFKIENAFQGKITNAFADFYVSSEFWTRFECVSEVKKNAVGTV